MKWLVPYFEKLILMDKMNTGVYQDAIERINQKKKSDFHITELQKHYWNTDFTFYQNPVYQFSVRMSSRYTQQAETDLNGENKKEGTVPLVLMHYCRMVQNTTISIRYGTGKIPERLHWKIPFTGY